MKDDKYFVGKKAEDEKNGENPRNRETSEKYHGL